MVSNQELLRKLRSIEAKIDIKHKNLLLVQAKEIFKNIEGSFESSLFCQVHDKWCDCWGNFKNKYVGQE